MLKKPGTGFQDWRIPRTWLGTWIGFITILASVLAATASAQTSAPSGCTFLSAPGAVPAFCDTFDQPAGTGNRSGDLNGTVWGVSRLLGGVNTGQGQYYDVSPTTMEKCGQSVQVQPPNDVAICNGQLVEAQNDQGGVTSLAMYPKQPFDIAGRTGTVAFDVSDDTHGNHRAWPEFWYTDKPMPAPFTHFSSLQEVPKDGFGVRFAAFCPAFGDPGCGIRPACPEYPISVSVISVDSAVVINNYVSNDSFTDVTAGPISVKVVGCVKASSGPGDMNHFELRVSQNEIDVYGVDAGATGPLKKIAVITNMSLTLTRGLVWLEDVHYNGNKEGPDQGTHTFTWDNVAFDGPVLARDLAFDVPDRLTPVGAGYPGLLNLGWPISPGGPPLTLTVPGVYNIAQAAGAVLTFNYSTDNAITLSYKVNNGVWHDQPWPFPACFTQNGNVSCGAKTIAVPVPLSEVQPGTNTIQFKTADSTNNIAIANVDLILIGAGGIVCSLNCPTTTGVTSSKNPSNWGDAVTFTATVTGSGGTAGTPSGSVTFSDSTTVLGTGTLDGSGVATFTISSLAVGNHTITATYSGDGKFTASTGSLNTNPQVVNQAITATAVTSSKNPSNFGDAVTFTAIVSCSSGIPSGTVTFNDSTTVLGTGALSSSGIATFTTSSLAMGNHTITAQYAGNTNFTGSTGPLNTNPQVVNQAVSMTAVATSANPSNFGQSVTFTATVAAADLGVGTPTGTVTFKDGASTLGTAALNGSGQASFATSSLTVGTHNITAAYGGDTVFLPSASPSFTQVVIATGNATTTTLMVNGGSSDPVYFGFAKGARQKAGFAVTVTGSTDGDSVVLMEGNRQIGPVLNLNSGQTIFNTQLSVGQHSVRAIYLGNNTAAGSVSSIVTVIRSPRPKPR